MFPQIPEACLRESCILAALAMNYLQTLWSLLFVFLIPILYFLDTHSADSPKEEGSIWALFYMFLFGFVFSLCSTYWFFSTYPLDWLQIYDPRLSLFIIGGIWVSFGIVMGLSIALWAPLVRFIKTENILLSALVGAACWVTLEYARSWMVVIAMYGPETLFGPHHTYYSLAYAIPSIPLLKEMLPVGGLYLGSFVLILINYFLYHCILTLFLKKNARTHRPVFLGTLICSMVFISTVSMNVLRRGNIESSFDASVITTNLPTGTKNSVKEQVAFEAVNEIENENALIILPENVNLLPLYVQNKNDASAPLYKNRLVVGSFIDKFAVMFVLDPQNGYIQYSGKKLLMPVGEASVSWVTFLLGKTQSPAWLEDYKKMLRVSDRNAPPFVYKDSSVPNLVLATSLCSENISPYIYRDATRLGATVFVNPSSHSPYRGSPLLARQTMAINSTRALENGRYFITAANSTQSFVITDAGIVQDISAPSKELYSHFNTKIRLKTYMTPYVLYGDYVVYASMVVLALALTQRLFYTRRRLISYRDIF